MVLPLTHPIKWPNCIQCTQCTVYTNRENLSKNRYRTRLTFNIHKNAVERVFKQQAKKNHKFSSFEWKCENSRRTFITVIPMEMIFFNISKDMERRYLLFRIGNYDNKSYKHSFFICPYNCCSNGDERKNWCFVCRRTKMPRKSITVS